MFYLYAALFLSIMNLTSIKILLPEIMAGLGVELNWLTWVVNAYTLPLAVIIPVAGRIGDLYGPRRFFILGVIGLGFGSLLCGTAMSLPWLIAGRAVQALGAAFLVPNSLTILLAKAAPGTHGRVLGIWGGIGAFGAVVGPVVSGLMVEGFSWKSSFILVGFLSLVIAGAAWRNMTAPPAEDIPGTIAETPAAGERKGFDIAGAALLMSAGAVLLMSITLLPDWGWHNAWIQAGFVFFALLLFLFYRVQRTAAEPLISPELLKRPRFSLGLLVGFLEQFVMAGTLFVLPIFFITIHGYTSALTALLLTPAATAVALVAPLGGRLSDRFGPGPPIMAGMLLRMISFLLLSMITLQTGYPFIAGCMALNGIGFGLSSAPALNAVVSTVSASRHGIASGLHNMIRFTGAAMGTAIGGIILYTLIPASFTGLTGTIPGFREVFLLSAAFCLPGIPAGFLLWKKYP